MTISFHKLLLLKTDLPRCKYFQYTWILLDYLKKYATSRTTGTTINYLEKSPQNDDDV